MCLMGCDSASAARTKNFQLVFQNAGILRRAIKVMRNEIKGSMPFLINRVSLGGPCFAKTANAGSSVGVSKVKGPQEIK